MTTIGATQQGVFPTRPTKQSIFFAGRYINISALHRTTGIHLSTFSYALSGKSRPTMDTARKWAAGLGMSVDALFDAIEAHVASHKDRQKRIVSKYDGRGKHQIQKDMNRVRLGLAPEPIIPLEKSL